MSISVEVFRKRFRALSKEERLLLVRANAIVVRRLAGRKPWPRELPVLLKRAVEAIEQKRLRHEASLLGCSDRKFMLAILAKREEERDRQLLGLPPDLL